MSVDVRDAAAAIAIRIARRAVWHEGRCTWIAPLPAPDARGLPSEIVEALGPGLYAGTAGVALALGQIGVRAGDREVVAAARGAMAHALRRAEPRDDPGLYTGASGVGLVAVVLAHALGDEGMAGRGRRLMHEVTLDGPAGDDCDLVSGRAGCVLALLAAGRLLRDGLLLAAAVRLGEELVARATPGAPWAPHGSRALCGLAHGASGPALALAALAGETGYRRFADAAEDGLAHERALFDARTGGWPDLREPPLADAPAAWCHGGPGIALAHAEAARALDGRSCPVGSRAGLVQARAAAARLADDPSGDRSPCHGLLGLAEILADAACDDPVGGWREAADDTARAALDDALRGRGWRCATTSETPALMVGLAGIALALLRIEEPDAVSALHPWRVAGASSARDRHAHAPQRALHAAGV